ncbi:MAG: hypothetical protein JJT96_10930, partial [Opitutales bacterium]|nr:hypothetical protein [Opitutales bacterium]
YREKRCRAILGFMQQRRGLKQFGSFSRIESKKLIRGYSFDMLTHELKPTHVPNPSAGTKHLFRVFRSSNSTGPTVTLK